MLELRHDDKHCLRRYAKLVRENKVWVWRFKVDYSKSEFLKYNNKN
jgi:hypothetical protein